MNVLLFAIIWLCLSILFLFKDNRSFIWSVSLCMSCLLLLSISIYHILSMVHQLSNNIADILVGILFLCGVMILISLGIILLKNSKILKLKEGKSLVAKISSLFGINFILLIILSLLASTSIIHNNILNKITTIIFLVDLFTCVLFAIFLIYSYFYQMTEYNMPIDYIIVLGSGINSEEVTPLLRSRLDKAISYCKKQRGRIKFVVSGGQGEDEPISEAEAMKRYLIQKNIPEESILMENSSTSTLENMRFSKIIILEDFKRNNLSSKHEPVVLFSTSNYHVFRSAQFARKSGLNAHGIGAPTALYFLPSALIREFIGLLYLYKYSYIVIVLLISLLVIGM